MYLPKQDIFELLSTLGCGVSQTQPTTFNELPFINFSILDNSLTLTLENEIAYQDIDVQIDIWGDTSVEASNLLSEVEQKMRDEGYLMNYSADVPNPSNIFHIVSRFNKKGGN